MQNKLGNQARNWEDRLNTSLLSDVHQWMIDSRADAVNRLVRWSDQNSWSLDADNLHAMSSVIRHDFASLGVDLTPVDLPPLRLLGDQEDWIRQPTGPALIWHHNDQATRRLLMMIHFDTVYPSDAVPNRCAVQGRTLIGPGVADAKGGIAVIAMAIEAILKFDLANDIGLSILLNPDEEIGSTASRPLMEELAPKFDAALLFEPTLPDGSLVAARKGSGNFSFVVRGRSAHAGRNPDQGRNAIVHLASVIPSLAKLHDPAGGTLVNIGNVQGGGPLNRVPDHAVVQFNVRVANPLAMERIKTDLSAIAEQFNRGDYQVTLLGDFHCPPKLVDLATKQWQDRVADAGAAAGRTIVWKDTGGACDGCKLAAMGLPNIDTLGVGGGALHSPEEFCDLDTLVPAALTVATLVRKFGQTK